MKSEMFRKGKVEEPENKNLSNDDVLQMVHIKENKDSYIAEIKAEGMDQEDFKLKVFNGVLYVTAIYEDNDVKKEENYYEENSIYSSFQQSFMLPKDADEESIKASMENNILTIKIEKKIIEGEKNSLRQIPVEEEGEMQTSGLTEDTNNKKEGSGNFLNKIKQWFRDLFK